MANEDESMERMIRLQLKLTPSEGELGHPHPCLDLQVSRLLLLRQLLAALEDLLLSECRALQRTLANCRPGVPGTRMALLRGDLGVMGMATDSRLPPM